MLGAAALRDQEATRERVHIARRAMLAVMIFAGYRIGELCALRRREFDLARGWIQVARANRRRHAQCQNQRHAARCFDRGANGAGREPDAFVFPSRSGAMLSADNLRNRIVNAAVERAPAELVQAGKVPLPPHITPHFPRLTFWSVLYALGEDPGTVMDEMGHTHPGFALRIYRQATRRDQDEKAALRALVDGSELEFDAPLVHALDPDVAQSTSGHREQSQR